MHSWIIAAFITRPVLFIVLIERFIFKSLENAIKEKFTFLWESIGVLFNQFLNFKMLNEKFWRVNFGGLGCSITL